MRKLSCMMLLLIVLLSYQTATATANRRVMQKYSLNEQGLMVAPLVVDFGTGPKNPKEQKIPMSSERNLLLITFIVADDEVFTLPLFNSYNYSVYKARLRYGEREELLVLGLGKDGGSFVQLREAYIIGLDHNDAIRSFPVSGFTPRYMRNVPVQLENRRNIMLIADKGGTAYYIHWDQKAEEFVMDDYPAS